MAFNNNIVFNAGIETTREYLHGDKVKSINTRIELKVSPFIPPNIPIELLSTNLNGIIDKWSWVKTRSNPYGKWNVDMVADNEALKNLQVFGGVFGGASISYDGIGLSLRDVIKPMTYSQFWHNGNHVMSGFNRSLRRIRDSNGRKMFRASYDEIGAVYDFETLDFQGINYGKEQHILQDPTKILEQAERLVGIQLHEAMKNAVNAFKASTLGYGTHAIDPTIPFFRLSDGIPLALRLIAAPPPFGGISESGIITQFTADSIMFSNNGSTFWDYLKIMCPDPFMELFTESGGRTICVSRTFGGVADTFGVSVLLPGMSYIIARTSPYSHPLLGLTAWHPLLLKYMLDVYDLILAGDFIIITDDDVIEKDLGVSDEQQNTLFFANMGGRTENSAEIKTRPSVAYGSLLSALGLIPGGIKTYGARSYKSNVTPIGSGEDFIGRTIQKTKSDIYIPALSTLLNYWFRNASRFNEGTIKTRPYSYARPGMIAMYLPSISGSPVDDPRDIGIYYIDTVESEGSITGEQSTTFKLIRGIPIPTDASSLINYLVDWDIGFITQNTSDVG